MIAFLRTLLAALTCMALSTSGHAVEPDGQRIAVGERVTLAVPADMTRDTRPLGPRGDMLTLADGNDVMVVVVYRKVGNERAPRPGDALEVHTAELEAALGTAARRPGTQRVMGREQPSIHLAFTRGEVERDAWVVAFESLGRTIVVSAVTVRGSPNEATMANMLKGMRVQ